MPMKLQLLVALALSSSILLLATGGALETESEAYDYDWEPPVWAPGKPGRPGTIVYVKKKSEAADSRPIESEQPVMENVEDADLYTGGVEAPDYEAIAEAPAGRDRQLEDDGVEATEQLEQKPVEASNDGAAASADLLQTVERPDA